MGILIIITILCCLSVAQASLDMEDIPSSMMMNRFWIDWVEDNILPSVRVGHASSNDSRPGYQCFLEIEKILAEGGTKRDIVLDATGKPTSGLQEGNLAWLGDYRQCVDTVDLQYCLISAKFGADHVIRGSGKVLLGSCVPDVCTEEELTPLLRYIRAETIVGDFIGGLEVFCSAKLDPFNDPGFFGTVLFLLLLCLLCICATAFESYWNHRIYSAEERKSLLVQSTCNSCKRKELPVLKELPASKRSLICFSLTRSVNQITNTTSAKDDITCLHGIRVISMFWIILGHSMSYQQKSGAMADALWVYSVPAKYFTSQATFNSYVALDTFFFLGGLLAAYTGFKYMSKSVGRVNWFVAILHRYMRITPSMAVMILLYTFVYPYFGEGPFWYQRVSDCNDCYQWWWTNFLYINNFVPENTSGSCLSWSWYLATDMQLFLVAIIIIVLLWWFPKVGIVVLTLTTLSSVAVRAAVTSLRDYSATQFIFSQQPKDPNIPHMFIFSVKPYACAPAYLVGVAMGYCLHIWKNKPLGKLKVTVVLLGWVSAFAIGMSLVYGLYGAFDHPGSDVVPPVKAVNVVYGSLKGVAWASALCWVVFACHHGYGGVINRFLSWSFWIPLSRLTFCAYLLHPAVIYLYTGTLSMTFSFTMIPQSFLFAGFVTMSYSAAFILSSLVEMPIGSLQKMFIKR